MDTSNHRQSVDSKVECRPPCNDECFNYDKSSHSRRSIDWRDSGIVIDEDHQLFHSFDNICNLDTQSSIWSECEQKGTEDIGLSTRVPTLKSVSEQDDDGDTILHLAVVGFTLNRVRDLISVCDLDAINNMMQTPLHVAILANRPEMVQILVQANARLDIHDRRGNTPLHVACQKGLLDIVDILLGALTNNPTKRNNLTVEQALGASNFDGCTCLHLAAMYNHKDIIELLVGKYRAQPNVRDSKSGETILHMAIRRLDVELTTFLLELHEHFNAPDFSGRDPLKTIEVLQESYSTDQVRRIKLTRIKQLVDDKIKECADRGGCCANRQSVSFDATDSSASSSDYSDSDY